MFMWYTITFLIYFDISFDFEMKRKKKQKKFTYFKERKKEKIGIEPGPTDSESDLLTTVLSRRLKLRGLKLSCILNVT